MSSKPKKPARIWVVEIWDACLKEWAVPLTGVTVTWTDAVSLKKVWIKQYPQKHFRLSSYIREEKKK